MKLFSRRLFLGSAALATASGCIDSGSGGGNGPAGAPLRCLMVTDCFSDSRSRRKDFAAIRDAGYNAVYGVVDLQLGGRPHVVYGRTLTALTSNSTRRIAEARGEGLMPVLGIRNDWGHDRGYALPSGNTANFYSDAKLEQEKAFCDHLVNTYGSSIGLFLALEATHPAAGAFYGTLANHVLTKGFRGHLLVNCIGEAARTLPMLPGITTAHSFHGLMQGKVSPHAVHNTDGDRDITPDNANEARKRLLNLGKPWILWAEANIRGGVHPAFLRKMT